MDAGLEWGSYQMNLNSQDLTTYRSLKFGLYVICIILSYQGLRLSNVERYILMKPLLVKMYFHRLITILQVNVAH